MPDLDLDKIRADWDRLRGLLDEMADGLANPSWGSVIDAARWADALVEQAGSKDLPALIAVAEDHARLVPELRALADRLREVTAERDQARAAADDAVYRLRAIANLANTSRPVPAGFPATQWTVIDEVHVTTSAELREALGHAEPVSGPESPQDAPDHPGTHGRPERP